MLTAKAWKDLVRINKWVNDTVKPVTDLEHWGVVERWNYPDDGYGDCEDYVLLKRRMLMQAGWPRQALLITVVRDKRGDGHAVLTVKTDRGEFVLDNQNEDDPALVGDRLPLRQASVADRSERLGRARRSSARPPPPPRRPADRERLSKELRVPGHVPTPPRPQTGFARGRPSPEAGRTFLRSAERSVASREAAMRRSSFRAPVKKKRPPSHQGPRSVRVITGGWLNRDARTIHRPNRLIDHAAV